jgi:hypothetical protein
VTRPCSQSFGVGVGPHQSPIRFKALGVLPLSESSTAPSNLDCARKLSVPRRVQGLGSQIHWLSLSGHQPHSGSRRGRPSNHSTGELSMSLRDGDSGRIRSCGSKPTPTVSSLYHPNRKNFLRRKPDSHQTVLRRASHRNKPAPACALPP